MHEHDTCKHELKYCVICDVVYCEKCKKEWTYNKYVYPYPTTAWPNSGITITYGTDEDWYR